MGPQPIEPRSGIARITAYDRRRVEAFLADASAERRRLEAEIALARQRVVDAEAALADASDTELRVARMVLELERVVRQELRAGMRQVAEVLGGAKEEGNRLTSSAEGRAGRLEAATASVEPSRPAPAAPAPAGPPPPAARIGRRPADARRPSLLARRQEGRRLAPHRPGRGATRG